MDIDLNSALKTQNSELIGTGDNKTYGADIGPSGGQDMFAYDGISGQFPPQERDADPATFTGGTGGAGLGGTAEPASPSGISTKDAPNSLYERRGF